jgi:hypothetical protein
MVKKHVYNCIQKNKILIQSQKRKCKGHAFFLCEKRLVVLFFLDLLHLSFSFGSNLVSTNIVWSHGGIDSGTAASSTIFGDAVADGRLCCWVLVVRDLVFWLGWIFAFWRGCLQMMLDYSSS